MLVVLAYWAYILVLTSIAGLSFQRLLKIQSSNATITILLGSFFITLIASIYCLFSGLGAYFEVALLLISTIYAILSWKTVVSFFLLLKAKWDSFLSISKLLSTLVLLLAAAKCAGAPYLIDNESYYIQTIKWLDTHGFVPGLGNLHPFLSQTSGFHILQSATNWNFAYPHINDLAGFFLVVGNFYGFCAFSKFFITRNKTFLIAGLFPVFNVLLFQFISAPSPDIALFVIFLVILFEFWNAHKEICKTLITTLFLLSVFAIYIKLTAVVFVLFPTYLIVKNRNVLNSQKWNILVVSGIAGILFIIKNSIISGYPLYPLDITTFYNPDWKVSSAIQSYIIDSTKHYGYFLTNSQYENASRLDLFKHWIFLPKLHGLFNKLIVILLIVFPIVIWRLKNIEKQRAVVLYLFAFVHLFFLFVSSPQYRFFLMFIIGLCCITIAQFKLNETLIKLGLICSTLLITVPLLFSLDLNTFTKNKFHLSLSPFQSEYIVVPHPISKYVGITYEEIVEGNTTIYTPENIEFFWATGDGPLPCLQQKQLDYFKTYDKVVPQQRSENLKDGFFAKTVNTDE